MAAREPVFMSDGEVDPISHQTLPAPRIPRDRSLTFGQMLAMVATVGIFIYGAGFLVWEWIKS